MDIFTKGNVKVNEIKIGDIHYEYQYNLGIKSRVVTLPTALINEDGFKYWNWKSQHILPDGTEKEGDVIDYGVAEGMGHYGPNIYDYEAYQVKKYI